MKLIRTLFILLTLSSIGVLQARTGRSVNRLKLRVGETDKIGGYDKITAQSSGGKVHIAKNSDDSHSITGMDDGMVILKFYDEDGEEVLEKAIDVRERRPERYNNAGIAIGIGYPGYYYSSDPWYDPLYGWGPYRHSYHRGYYPYW